MNGCIITGINTEVGKTVVSAIVATALHADYWKPIQIGQIGDQSDRAWIEGLHIRTHKEAYHLKFPLTTEKIGPLSLPETERFLVIEGCGGVLCPFGQETTLLDTFAPWNLPWIVVSMHYLGSLNHTQLTVHKLVSSGQTVWGLVFNGPFSPLNEQWLIKELNLPLLGKIDHEPLINLSVIQCYAQKLSQKLKQFGIPLSKEPSQVPLSPL